MRLAPLLFLSQHSSTDHVSKGCHKRSTPTPTVHSPKLQTWCFALYTMHSWQHGVSQPHNSKPWWLLGCFVAWAVIASWLWPQLALWAGWMSHRRPTLPSVAASVFLTLIAEGLLEALELVFSLFGTALGLLRRSMWRLTGRLQSDSCLEPKGAVQPSLTCQRYDHTRKLQEEGHACVCTKYNPSLYKCFLWLAMSAFVSA